MTNDMRASRRLGSQRLFIACTLIATQMAATQPLTADERPPNVVMFLADDHRWDVMGCAGHAIVETPAIDRLASDGVRMLNSFVTTSICMTSRATMFTGQYESRHGITHTRPRPFTPEQYAATYPARFKAAGYRVGFIGKFHVPQPPVEQFDYWGGFPGQGQYYHEVDGQQRHLTSMLGDRAIEFLEGCSDDEPFCLSVWFKAPHVQDGTLTQPFLYDPALESLYADAEIPVPQLAEPRYFEMQPEFIRRSEARRRWELRFGTSERYQASMKGHLRLITGIDRVVGRVHEELERRGWDENTVIVYTSDNGYYLGEYGLAGKWFMHEVSIRTPLMIRDPRAPESTRGTTRDEVVLNIDVASTLLDLAGLPVPEVMQGRSMRPLVEGAEVADWRDDFFYEYHYSHRGRLPPVEGVREPRWKYWRYLEPDPPYEELYDLATDPQETENLAGSPAHADELARMRGKWAQYREQVR